MNHNSSLMIILVTSQGVGSEMNDPFEAYRKSKSYSFIGSRIGKYFSQLISGTMNLKLSGFTGFQWSSSSHSR